MKRVKNLGFVYRYHKSWREDTRTEEKKLGLLSLKGAVYYAYFYLYTLCDFIIQDLHVLCFVHY